MEEVNTSGWEKLSKEERLAHRGQDFDLDKLYA